MGKYATRLKRRLTAAAGGRRGESEPLTGELLADGSKDIAALILEGFNPFHAVYVFWQNVTATFAENVAPMPEMKVWSQAVEAAEDEYMPAGPPISPLTASYFWMWALYDLRIGNSRDTLASCLIAAKNVLQLNVHQVQALKKMHRSRMGIYEHAGMSGPYIRLKELVNGGAMTCFCPSGYQGAKSQLWYVRLLPPLEPRIANVWIAMTTPYVLIGAEKSDWSAFLRRTRLQCDGSDEQQRLYHLMKCGPQPNYWNEFVLKAYHHHQQEAIFLTGIPDIESTLPHA